MRKTLLTIVIMLALASTAKAQGFYNDNFFINDYITNSNLDKPDDPSNPIVPGGHNYTNDISAPLGSGLLILTALGSGYAFSRKKRLQ